MKDDSRYSEAPAIGFGSVVRLIFVDEEGKILLVRYEATGEEWEPDHGEYRHKYGTPSYWSFIGLPSFRIIGHEASVAEAVVRVADRQLGVQISDLEYVAHLYDKRHEPPRLGRIYVWVRSWTGSFPEQITTPGHKQNGGLYDWVIPDGLMNYLSHPELILAHQLWEKTKQKKAGA